MAALENVDAFFLRRDHIVTVEIGAALLEFGEILDRFERALRAKQPLNEHASQSGDGDAMAGLRRTSIGRKMRRPVGMTVRVAIEAGHAPARLLRAMILGLVELLLRKRRHQKTQGFVLLRIDDAAEQLVIILDGDELALRNVAEVRTLIEIYSAGGKSGKK